MDKSNTKLHPIQIAIYVFFLIALFVFEFSDIQLSNNVLVSMMLTNSMFRIVGGLIFMSFMITYGYKRLYQFPISWKIILIILPALIISINNFPIIAYFSDRTYLLQEQYTVIIFAFDSLSNAFFEEVLFRSIVLILLLERFSKTKEGIFKAIIVSSVVFSLLHIINLFTGESVTNVLMQLGYSFLMGMLWAVMYLKTKNLWLTILLHATYNFFGQVMFSLGIVNGRYDIYTIIITVVLALSVTVYGFKLYLSLPDTIYKFKEDE